MDATMKQVIPESFSNIQQRRFWIACKSAVLCPSMDLVGLINASNQLTVHRSLSWDVIGTVGNAAAACWRPDGRVLAVVSSGSTKDPASKQKDAIVSLYSVEGLLRGDEPSLADEEKEDTVSRAGRLHSFSLENAQITAFCWAHVCVSTVASDTEMWDLRLAMFGEEISGAPRLESSPKAKSEDREATENMEQTKSPHQDLPSLKTPLSVLAVVSGTQLHFYAHGLYPILRNLQLPKTEDGGSVTQVVASSDLVTWVMLKPPNHFHVSTAPPLSTQRYDWQAISTLHSHIAQLLSGLKDAVVDLVTLWRTTLKQLDWKLDGLVKLFRQYSNDMPTNRAMLQYATNAARHPSLDNAADQFFTSTAVNDQLLQRLERSLQGSLANLQHLLNKNLVQASHSLARAVDAYWSLQWDAPHLDARPVTEAIASVRTVPAQEVYDTVAWLRAAAAGRKAAGTAVNSTQRQNAIQRRLSDAQCQRIVGYWKRAGNSDLNSGGTTEKLFGLQFQQQLQSVQMAIESFETTFAQEQSRIEESSIQTTTVRMGDDTTTTTELRAIVVRPGKIVSASVGRTAVTLCEFPLPLGSALGVQLVWDDVKSIVDVGFYGDDGRSSLDPTHSMPERRQRLGVLTVSSSNTTQLWLIDYPFLPWETLTFTDNRTCWECGGTSQLTSIHVESLAGNHDNGDAKVLVRMRTLNNLSESSSMVGKTRVSLSGSRGVGIVYATDQGGSAEVLDLEEHEAEEEEEEDESMEEE